MTWPSPRRVFERATKLGVRDLARYVGDILTRLPSGHRVLLSGRPVHRSWNDPAQFEEECPC